MFTRLSRSFVVVCVVLTACAPADDTDEATQNAGANDSATASPAVTQQDVEQGGQSIVNALRAGDGAAAATHYSSDAVFVSARGKVDGATAIGDFWTKAAANGAGKGLTLETVKWGASGDIAYSLSRYTGGMTAPTGHVLAVMQRQADGTLKTVAQISIPDAPATSN